MSGTDIRRGRRDETEDPRPLAKWFGYGLLTLALVGAVAGYVVLGQKSELAGTLPLPKSLQTRSPAHEDLMLFGRALSEVAVEAESRLPDPPGLRHPLAPRLLSHVDHLHDVGRQLQPRVSRDEGRALVALQQGEGLLRAFVAGEGIPPFDHGLIQQAKDQIELGLLAGRGQKVDQLLLGKRPHTMADERKDADAKKKKKDTIDPLHPAANALKLPMDGVDQE